MYAAIAPSPLRIPRARIHAAAILLCAATLSTAIMQPAPAGRNPNRPPWYGYGGPYFGPYFALPRSRATAAESSAGPGGRSRAGGNSIASRPKRRQPQAARAERSPTPRTPSRRISTSAAKPATIARPSASAPIDQAVGRYARCQAPRLSLSELDSLTGRINWPILLGTKCSRNQGRAGRALRPLGRLPQPRRRSFRPAGVPGDSPADRRDDRAASPADSTTAPRLPQRKTVSRPRLRVQSSNRSEGPPAADVSQTTQ